MEMESPMFGTVSWRFFRKNKSKRINKTVHVLCQFQASAWEKLNTKKIIATKVQIRANKPTYQRTNICINCMNERTKEWTSDHKTKPRKWPWTACSFTFVYEIETNANIPIKQNIWFWNKFALLVCWAIFSLLCKSVIFLFNTQRVCECVLFFICHWLLMFYIWLYSVHSLLAYGHYSTSCLLHRAFSIVHADMRICIYILVFCILYIVCVKLWSLNCT